MTIAEAVNNTNVGPSVGLILLTILLVVIATALIVWVVRRLS